MVLHRDGFPPFGIPRNVLDFLWAGMGLATSVRNRWMLWAIVSAACVGILLGLWLRVASVVAASLILAVVSTPLLPLFTEWSLLIAVGFLFALLSALQCGYLVGAVIACSQNSHSVSQYWLAAGAPTGPQRVAKS